MISPQVAQTHKCPRLRYCLKTSCMANVSPMQPRKVGSVKASKRLEYPTNALGYHLVDNGAKLVIGDHSFMVGDAVYVVMEDNVDWEDLQRSDPCEQCNTTTGRLIECNRCNGAWHPKCANCKDEKVHCVSCFTPLLFGKIITAFIVWQSVPCVWQMLHRCACSQYQILLRAAYQRACCPMQP